MAGLRYHKMDWIYANASVIGTSHQRIGVMCQDFNICEVVTGEDSKGFLVTLVSDGAGSAKYADRGSREICTYLFNKIKEQLITNNQLLCVTKEMVQSWIKGFHEQLMGVAEQDMATLRDYACTLLVAIVGEDSAVYFQIGDGAIIVQHPDDPDEYCYVFWPQQGNYENETFFATDPNTVASELQFEYMDKTLYRIALFTDGIQRLVLDYQNRVVHTPFFRPLFLYLETLSPGFSAQFTNDLTSFLESDRVNIRTDDDKTLILAARFEI